MPIKLDPAHEAHNQQFIFPAISPIQPTMEQTVEFWKQNPPHAAIFQIPSPVSTAEIRQTDKKLKLNLPHSYKIWLNYANGLNFVWKKKLAFIFSLDELSQELEDWKQEISVIAENLQADYGRDWIHPLFPEIKAPEGIKLRKFFPIGRDLNNDLYLLYPQANKEDILFFYSHNTYEIKLKSSNLGNYLWFLNLYGHTHPQETDERLRPFLEKNIAFKP